MNDDEIEDTKMHNALSAIAKEMQKFHKDSVTGSHKDKGDSEEILNKLIKCKTALNLRKIQIKKLRKNLKTACSVAKTMSSAKTAETSSLTNHLSFARSKYMDLAQEQKEKNELISNLSSENHALRDQLNFFNNVIELGYQDLQKMRNQSVENVSTMEQLKHIIICCGQYYADHYSEHERCTRLEQKNKFLNTKIIIMKNTLEAATDELRNLRTYRPLKDKNTSNSSSRSSIGSLRSDYKIGSHLTNFAALPMTKIEVKNRSPPANVKDLDLTIHLKTVKRLLDDQDNLIKDLKNLSKVINVDET